MDPFPLIEEYGPDPFRFYCFREVNFGQDGMVGEESFKARYNSELANDLGNLLSRSVSMIGKYRGGAAPTPPARPPAASPLAAEAAAVAEATRSRLDEMDLSGALDSIWELVRRLNRYVEEQAPWKLAKAGEDEALDATLYDLAEGLRLLSVLLHPYMPGTSARMRERLGLGVDEAAFSWAEAEWGRFPAGAIVTQGDPLFPRIESE